uniref:COG4 transport protein middle alpha-helical bundle domain-containing protein n=1 Tax=Aegilops tauschii TaxID=37682 RepID=N1QTZ9_AEGTA
MVITLDELESFSLKCLRRKKRVLLLSGTTNALALWWLGSSFYSHKGVTTLAEYNCVPTTLNAVIVFTKICILRTRLDEDLHFTTLLGGNVNDSLLLDVVVSKGAPLLKLLASREETLVARRKSPQSWILMKICMPPQRRSSLVLPGAPPTGARASEAVDAQDHPAVLRLVRLFPLLDLAPEGLQVYVAYLKKVVALRARADFEHLTDLISATQPTPERPDFVGCLTRLFKDIVLAVEENDAVLRELRGEDGVAYAIIELQEECDSRGTQILRRYADYRKLARLSSDINSYTKNLLSVMGSVANAAGGSEGPDPREVEIYLEEILALTQLGEDYTEFMVNKIRGLRDVKPELGPQAMKAFRNGSFNKMEKDLTGYYVILEEFFMVENIRKAIQIDEPVPDGLTTSMVDDVFFLLQSCCRRAAFTASINSLLAVLGGATSLLSNEFQEALQWRMREPNLGAKLFLGGVGVQKTGEEIATALNNMDVSSEYVLKLRHEVEELCAEIFHAPADREKIKSCLSELGEINASYKKILYSGLEHLVASIAPRIRPVLDTVTTVSYELDDAEYGENEVNDPWVQKLLLAVDTNVTWLQPMMTSNNYDSFVHLVIDFIVKRLEVIMMQKRFSQLGGLQLDKEVRSLINHFSEMSQRPVRDKFSRLSQMSTILNFERVSEILDFWGDNAGHLTWLLTPAEVRRVLGLRIDFRPEAISALRL